MKLRVGNTPMIKIKYAYKGEEKYIYTKLESYNVTGSIKDRVADYIIRKAYDGLKVLGNGDITKKLTVEATVFSATAKEKIEAAGGKTEVI